VRRSTRRPGRKPPSLVAEPAARTPQNQRLATKVRGTLGVPDV